jgi:hypothetical protein
MNLATSLLRYVVAAAVLAGGLAGSIAWLIKTDNVPVAQAKPAPLPPRIADSIERKKTVIPVAPVVSSPIPTKPVLQEANVALRPERGTRQVIRELAPVSRDKAKRQQRSTTARAVETKQPASVVTTARTDVPY